MNYVQVKKDTSLTFDVNESKYLGFSKELSGKFLRITLKISNRREKRMEEHRQRGKKKNIDEYSTSSKEKLKFLK